MLLSTPGFSRMANMDKEAEKKNTDCVYFLASPLTCKKGNDCDYRHSESARINPRDCWYWFSGTCLNSNCPFRHPPLEGRPEPTPTAAGAVSAGKIRVPCFFFSQGHCAKGDKCAFMHGVTMPLSTEPAASQRPLKPATTNAAEPNDKQVAAVSKGDGSVTSKPSPGSFYKLQATAEPRSLRGETQLSNANAKVERVAESVMKLNDAVTNRMPEGSASSAPARPQSQRVASGSDRSRQLSLIDDRVHQGKPADDTSSQLPCQEDRMYEAQTGDDRLLQAQVGDEMLHELESGEDMVQNGRGSEEWWEESSSGFDVLVDDGIDQLINAEDFDYLSHQDVGLESARGHIQGRMMVTDDLADFEYENSGAYDHSGYYDTSVQYEFIPYDPYEQKLAYDHLNCYEQGGRQTAVDLTDRQIEGMLLRDRRGQVYEGEIRHSGSSGDLRNHILKRRRAERSPHVGDDVYRRRHRAVLAKDCQHSRRQHSHRHQDNHLKQQQLPGRHRTLAQTTRSNRRSHGWSESVGNKRTYNDISSEYEGISRERGFNKKPRNLGDNLNAQVKWKEHRQLAAQILKVKSQATLNNRKTQSKQDEATFAGPKSLAQIKAEKMKAGGEEKQTHRVTSEESKNATSLSCTNNLAKSHVLPIGSRFFPGTGSVVETAHKDQFIGGNKKNLLGLAISQVATKTFDFEGPKPLSMILKAKHKGDADGEPLEDARKEQVSKILPVRTDMEVGTGSLVVSSKTSKFSPVSSKDLEDGELQADTNLTLASCSYSVHRSDVKKVEPFQQNSHSHRDGKVLQSALSLSKCEGTAKEEADKVGHGLDSTGFMEDWVEAGDNVMEDVEFDDDDFASKLGDYFY